MKPMTVRIIALCFFVVATAGESTGQVIAPARRIDWRPGIPGGIPPRTTVCANVASFGAVGDGVHDDAPAIQSAINACPAGQVVSIPAGTFRLNSRLTITKGIVVRGAGANASRLQTYASWHGIQLGDFPSAPVVTNVSGSPAKGATAMTVTSTTSPSLLVGDYIVIDQLNDGIEVVNSGATIESGAADGRGNSPGTRNLSEIKKITAINGLTLTIDPPLYHAYSAPQNPQVWELGQGVARTVRAGIEDLSIERISPTDTSNGYDNILLVACVECWVKNIISIKANFRHVDLNRSFRCEIRDSYFNDGFNQGTGGFAYGVVAGRASADNLIENNIFRHLRHSMVLIEGASGNVFGYNYALETYQGSNWLATDMNAHGAHPHFNLFEGNIGVKVRADFTHGSSSYNTVFRTHVTRESFPAEFPTGITSARRAIDLEVFQRYWNNVGNVIGKASQTWTSFDPGSTRTSAGTYVYNFGYGEDGDSSQDDATIATSTFRHGNYDYATGTVRWDSTTSDHTLPSSLYLTSKPMFFGGLPWPSIGPDLQPLVGAIPAKERYEGRSIPTIKTPASPTNVRILP